MGVVMCAIMWVWLCVHIDVGVVMCGYYYNDVGGYGTSVGDTGSSGPGSELRPVEGKGQSPSE